MQNRDKLACVLALVLHQTACDMKAKEDEPTLANKKLLTDLKISIMTIVEGHDFWALCQSKLEERLRSLSWKIKV